MAKKKPEELVTEVDAAETYENEGSFAYPDFSSPSFGFGFPAGGGELQPQPFDFGGSFGVPSEEAGAFDEDDFSEKSSKKKSKKRKRRKESDYFFVNRKLPCFLITLLLLVSILVVGLGVLNQMPSMKENDLIQTMISFTALYRKPDMTAKEDRVSTTDEDGKTVKYKDKSEYVTIVDIVLGTVKKVFKIGGTEEDAPKAADTVTEEETEKEGGFSMDTPFYDSIATEVAAKGYESGLPIMLADYFGFAFVLFLLVALYYMLKSFAALFGKRVFRNFGWGSILMLVCGVVALFGSIGVLSIFIGEAGDAAKLQFGAIGDFIMGAFAQPPTFKFVMTEGADPVQLPFVAGYGMFIVLVLPVLTLLFSTMARKKLPYSIFD